MSAQTHPGFFLWAEELIFPFARQPFGRAPENHLERTGFQNALGQALRLLVDETVFALLAEEPLDNFRKDALCPGSLFCGPPEVTTARTPRPYRIWIEKIAFLT